MSGRRGIHDKLALIVALGGASVAVLLAIAAPQAPAAEAKTCPPSYVHADLSWGEAGPVGAAEEPSSYRHDGGISFATVLSISSPKTSLQAMSCAVRSSRRTRVSKVSLID